MEAALLGLFMLSASILTVLLEHPSSALRHVLPDAFVRRAIMGLGMGLTAVLLIFSPMGRRSGAHMNPAVTLAFMRLGKIKPRDALFYIAAQFIGGTAGVWLASLFLRDALMHPSVNFVATLPGPGGEGIAFAGEFAISFLLMLTVLLVSNDHRLSPWTGFFAGALVALYITFEAPLSGMSMNPARTFGSAFVGHEWTAWWIYYTAPVLAMLLAAEMYVRTDRAVHCAKLHHHNEAHCIFHCTFSDLLEKSTASVGDRREN
jgi:aquaporin Z